MDPNPLVNGKGLAELREAGLRVVLEDGESAGLALETVEAYVRFVASGLPFVVAKFAMSLDGKIATASGESQWITCEEARAYASELRRRSDAVAVGIGTVLYDNPRLTARDAQGRPLENQPLRVVVDSTGRTPPGAQLFREPGPVLVASASPTPEREEALCKAGAQVLRLPAQDGSVDLQALLRELGKRQITGLLVEGGGTLLGSFFDHRLVNKVVAFVAPAIVGGGGAPSPVSGKGSSTMSDVLRLRRPRMEMVGQDMLVTGYVE